MMLSAWLLLLACYGLLIVRITWLLRATSAFATPTAWPSVTVVVPFRNEQQHLPALIHALKAQDYPAESLTVVLVDDASTDSSVDVCRDALTNQPRFSCVPSDGSGKKAALRTGIAASGSEVILTTDADCGLPTDWVRSMAAPFADHQVSCVFGWVTLSGHRFMEVLQRLEFLSVVGVGVAAYRAGRPFYCNGANLAFRRSAFVSTVYRDDQATGDDTDLLQHILNTAPEGLRFVSGSPVIAASVQRWPDFFQQRIRWASKWRNLPAAAQIFALLFWCLQAAIMLAAMMTIASPNAFWMLFWAAKLLVDYLLLRRIARLVGWGVPAGAFLMLELSYPAYVVLTGIGALRGTYRWKGRVHGK